MPTRPASPSLPAILSEHARAIRELQRTRPGKVPPKDDSYIEVWDDGEPQGLFKLIDFIGGVVTVNPREEGQVEVNIASAASSMDAIVDGSAGASDPDSRLFLGIGEASQYLYDAGLTHNAVIGVRNHGNDTGSGTGTYTETADWDSPSQVHIVGLRFTGDAISGLNDNDFLWNWGGFKPNAAINLYLENCQGFTPGAGPLVAPIGVLMMRNSDLRMGGFATTFAVCSTLIAELGSITVRDNGNRRLASSSATMVQCDVSVAPTSGGAVVFIPAGTGSSSQLSMVGCRWMGANSSGSINVTLPPIFDLDVFDPDIRAKGGSDGSPFPTLNVPSSGSGRIRVFSEGLSGVWVVNATSAFDRLVLEGHFGDLTLTGAHDALSVVGVNNAGTWDLRGPAAFSCSVRGAGKVLMRGEGVVGQVGGDALTGSSGTVVDFVAADDCNVLAALDGTGTSGTKKPYAFDATSDNNVLVIAGRSSFPAAGTDAGTNNRILPEAAPPAGGIAPANADYLVGTANADLTSEIVVGTTPGGELGGTWASPTVDATHSGSAHADFIAKAFMDAKGDIITASADNTPVILTVGTNGFVLVADSTQASGLKWVSAGSLFTPTAGWGSITNVTPDKVYDANATTIDELADVLGTLVANLVAQGILAT